MDGGTKYTQRLCALSKLSGRANYGFANTDSMQHHERIAYTKVQPQTYQSPLGHPGSLKAPQPLQTILSSGTGS